jgi:peptidoglycan/xylan/chitin deacetylase (PgdA/CDA1 family)
VAEQDPAVSRRVVLLGVAGVVVGAGLLEGPTEPVGIAARRQSATRLPEIRPVSAQLAPRRMKTAARGSARHWKAPIYDLSDFVHANPGTSFPRRSVALTIDDGPNSIWTPKYLRLLAKHDIRATFNMIGAQVPTRQHLLKAMVSEGHSIANHTWSHDEHLPSRSKRDIHREIVHTNDVIHTACGVAPTLFRAPGGVWGPRLYGELDKLGMIPVDWNVDPRDWAKPGTGAIESAIRKAHAGDIILCHDGGGDRSETYAALQVVLPELKARGLHFVPL